MPTITKSDSASQGNILYTLGNSSFRLGDGEDYKTDDDALVADARVHPELVVIDDDGTPPVIEEPVEDEDFGFGDDLEGIND